MGQEMKVGPQIEQLTRRLAETPAEFREQVAIGKEDGVMLPAVVGETLQFMGVKLLPAARLTGLHPTRADQETRNHLQVALIGAWLLTDPWFAGKLDLASPALDWLYVEIAAVARHVSAEKFIEDGDRREELARLCLQALQLLPAGETQAMAQDRLLNISTVERKRLIQATKEAEERERKVREEMQRKAEEEAAAKGSRE